MGVLRRLNLGLSLLIAITALPASAEVPATGRAPSLHVAPTMFELSKSAAEGTERSRTGVGSEVGSMVPDKADLLGRAVKGIVYSMSLFGLLVWGYRRYRPQQFKVAEDIRIISRKTVAPRAQLLIVEVEQKRLLLSLTSENLSLVTELPAASWEQMLTQEDVMLAEDMIQASEEHGAFTQHAFARGSVAQGGR